MRLRRPGFGRLFPALAVLPLAAVAPGALSSSPAAAAPGGVTAVPPLVCSGDGTSGNRVQMVYAYEAGTPNRFAEREPTIRLAAWVAQQNINDSARREGAQRWLRFVTTSCQLNIMTIQVPAGSVTQPSWPQPLRDAGLTASNRKYAVVVENMNDCAFTDNGAATDDVSPGPGNSHNNTASWMNFAVNCFGGETLVHEFAHSMGAFSGFMPHNDGGNHCIDGIETLCGAGTPPLACPDPLAGRLMDCGRDDYFAINPQGSYLPTHWNVALDSTYLDAGTPASVQTVPSMLPAQLLRATDVEGTSIAFSWERTVAPQSTGWTMVYELLRNGVVVATTPEWKTTARVTGLPMNTSASYAVRTRFTYNGSTRLATSPTLTVTTNSSFAQAGAAENGATMYLANDLFDPAGKSLVMDLFAFNRNDNATVKQWFQTLSPNQRWKMTSAFGGTFTLTSDHSLKCLSPLGGATAVGTPIVQFTCNGSTAQRWRFTLISGVTYQIKTAAGTCIGPQAGGTTADVDLVLVTCSASDPTQRWTTNRAS